VIYLFIFVLFEVGEKVIWRFEIIFDELKFGFINFGEEESER
jgi:hypothetical protein